MELFMFQVWERKVRRCDATIARIQRKVKLLNWQLALVWSYPSILLKGNIFYFCMTSFIFSPYQVVIIDVVVGSGLWRQLTRRKDVGEDTWDVLWVPRVPTNHHLLFASPKVSHYRPAGSSRYFLPGASHWKCWMLARPYIIRYSMSCVWTGHQDKEGIITM